MRRLILGLLALSVPLLFSWWLIIPIWLGYAFLYTGYELILLGVLLDAFLGHGERVPVLYTLIAVGACILGVLVRSRMSMAERLSEWR